MVTLFFKKAYTIRFGQSALCTGYRIIYKRFLGLEFLFNFVLPLSTVLSGLIRFPCKNSINENFGSKKDQISHPHLKLVNNIIHKPRCSHKTDLRFISYSLRLYSEPSQQQPLNLSTFEPSKSII